MIWFIVKCASVIFGIWFLNGLRKVWKNPRVKLVNHSMFTIDPKDLGPSRDGKYTKKDSEVVTRIDVIVQSYLPPFSSHKETWFNVDYNRLFCRLNDGTTVSADYAMRVWNIIEATIADEKHKENLTRVTQ